MPGPIQKPNTSREISVLLAGLSFCVLLAAPAQAKSEYETATDLYTNHKYAEAALHFEAAARLSPNVSTSYYAAYSYLLAKQTDKAISTFWNVIVAHPSSPEASKAQTVLKQIDPYYERHASKAAGLEGTKNQAQTSNSTSLQTSRNADPAIRSTDPAMRSADPAMRSTDPAMRSADPRSTDPSPRSTDPTKVIDELVKVVPGTGKIRNVSPSFVATVKSMLSTIPPAVLVYLRDQRASIVVSPFVVENDLRIQNTAPRGWSGEKSWRESPAMTRGKVVYVGQYRLDSHSGNDVDTTSEMGVVRHETGHALNTCLGKFSDSEDFKHAYLLDAAQVPDDQRGRLDYFLQRSAAGPSETMAELFCYMTGGNTGNRVETCELVHRYFPLTYQVLQKKIESMQNP